MGEPLKNFYGPEIPRRIAEMIAAVSRDFDKRRFLKTALDGYEALELLPRGRHMAAALKVALPADFDAAAEILVRSLGPKLETTQSFGMAPFLYMPHAVYVADNGLDFFESAMRAQYEITQRFTAEYSIRPFLQVHTEKTLARLKLWARDSSPHVRRLASEGTRPRLPWASRLPKFQKDPSPVLEILELLKDDPELYVRRSVANNLNDIGKDHPTVLIQVARRWLKKAPAEREWLVRHALRSAVKRADGEALKLLGYGAESPVRLVATKVVPRRPKLGTSVRISVTLENPAASPAPMLADLRVFFVKANGRTTPKVFKMTEQTLPPHGQVEVSKSITLANLTTRKHYVGRHVLELILNGETHSLGEFHLVDQ